MKRVGAGITLAGVALALVTTPAQAAGTVHRSYPEQCDTYPDYPDGYVTVCYSSSEQYNDTVTPSGNESIVGKGTSSYSVTGASYAYSDTYDYKIHILLKSGAAQVVHQKYSDTFSIDGTTCTFTENYQFANGAVRHDKPAYSCS